MEFEDSVYPDDDPSCFRILFEYRFDPPYPDRVYDMIGGYISEKESRWARFMLHRRPRPEFPYEINLLKCFEQESVRTKKFAILDDIPYVLGKDGKSYEMVRDYYLLRGYDIVRTADKDAEVARCRAVPERDALGRLYQFLHPFDCGCLRGEPLLEKRRTLGLDKWGGNLWISVCRKCARRWLFWERERKGDIPGRILFYGIISYDMTRYFDPNEAYEHFARIGWYFIAVSEGVFKASGNPNPHPFCDVKNPWIMRILSKV